MVESDSVRDRRRRRVKTARLNTCILPESWKHSWRAAIQGPLRINSVKSGF